MEKQIEKDTLHELIRAAAAVVTTTASIGPDGTSFRFSDKVLFDASSAFLKKQLESAA